VSLAYFPMYPDDYEADTAHLTLAEDGAYNRLLRLCWRSPGCSIPADRNWVHRRLRALTDEDKSVVDSVLAEFFVLRENRYSNARLSKEFAAASEAHERRKNAGAKGGAAKSRKTQASADSIAVAKPKQPEPEPEPERSSSRAQAHDAAAPGSDQSQGAAPETPGAAPDTTTRERLLAAMGIGPDGIAGPSRFIGTATDMAEVAKWSGMGLDAAAQAQVIAEACRRQRSADPAWMPRRFSYFTGAMADLAKARAGAVQPSTSTADKVARWRKIARTA
jgi:uncharacterized protein YdaU (DUF1376 family)